MAKVGIGDLPVRAQFVPSIKEGAPVELIPFGDVEQQEDAEETVSYLFNVVDVSTGCLCVLRASENLAAALNSAFGQGGKRYGKIACVISRTGSAKKTRYAVKGRDLTAEEQKILKAVEGDAQDLSKIPVPEPYNKKTKKRK